MPQRDKIRHSLTMEELTTLLKHALSNTVSHTFKGKIKTMTIMDHKLVQLSITLQTLLLIDLLYPHLVLLKSRQKYPRIASIVKVHPQT